jgi:TPR repeat protein
MRSCLRHFSFCVFATLLCAGFSLGANLEDAKRAYHQRDYSTAVKEFTDLAEQGNWEAQLILGKMYMLGQGVAMDSDLAIKWFKAAAVQGDSEAQFFVGSLYLLPQKDVGEGLKWLRLSADQGEQDAQLLLGKAYMKGDKVLPRDPIQGEMWLRLAAKDNKEFYQDALHEAERQMTADQIAKGKELADVWKPSSTPSSGPQQNR